MDAGLLTVQEAKQLWKQMNPEYYTWMNSREPENNHIRALGHAHWDGFKMALQITGRVMVE